MKPRIKKYPFGWHCISIEGVMLYNGYGATPKDAYYDCVNLKVQRCSQ